MLTLWLFSFSVQFDQLSVLNFSQIIQASTSQVVVEASCNTHEIRRRGSLLLRWSYDCLWLAQSWEAGLLNCSDYNLRMYKCTSQHSDSSAQLFCQFLSDMLWTFFVQSLKVDRLFFIHWQVGRPLSNISKDILAQSAKTPLRARSEHNSLT